MSVAVEIICTEFIVIALICLFLLYHYQSSFVTKDVSATVYLSWILGFATVLILPYDFSVAVTTDNPDNSMLSSTWAFIYWSTFLLAWMILPIQMEYHSSGHFTFVEKLIDAAKRLFIAAGIAILVGVVYVVFMVIRNGLTIHEVLSFSMALSNTYGVLLVSFLMGNGLVALPKRLWRMGDIDYELKRIYVSVNVVEEKYQEARYALEDCEEEVHNFLKRVNAVGINNQKLQEYVQVLEEKIKSFNFNGRSKSRLHRNTIHQQQHPKGEILSDSSAHTELVNLHAKLMKCQLKLRANERRYKLLVFESQLYENLKDLRDNQNHSSSSTSNKHSQNAQQLTELSSNWCSMPIEVENDQHSNIYTNVSQRYCARYCGCLEVLVSLFRQCYYWYLFHCHRWTCKIFSVILAIISIIILWSEMLMSTTLFSPINYFMGIHNTNNNSNNSNTSDSNTDTDSNHAVFIQFIAFLFLFYMSFCSYFSLFSLNISFSYKLQAPQLSPPSSLIFNAEYLSRMQFALGYNFLLCLNNQRTSSTAFIGLMENMETIPVLGTSFTVYVPILMTIIALMTLFDVTGRVLHLLGVETEENIHGYSHQLDGCCCGLLGRRRTDVTDEDGTGLSSSSAVVMDSNLLEKYNTGKTIIKNELRLIHASRERQTPTAGKGDTHGQLLTSAQKKSAPPQQQSSGIADILLASRAVKSNTGQQYSTTANNSIGSRYISLDVEMTPKKQQEMKRGFIKLPDTLDEDMDDMDDMDDIHQNHNREDIEDGYTFNRSAYEKKVNTSNVKYSTANEMLRAFDDDHDHSRGHDESFEFSYYKRPTEKTSSPIGRYSQNIDTGENHSIFGGRYSDV